MSYLARLHEIQTAKREPINAPPLRSVSHLLTPFGSDRSEAFWDDLLPLGLQGWSEELAALALPDDWKAGLSRVDRVLPPIRFADWQWRRLLQDVRHVTVNWGEVAVAAGWTLYELFGRAPMFAKRLDLDGIAMLLEGRKIVAVDDTALVIENGNRAAHRFQHKRMAGAKLLWDPG